MRIPEFSGDGKYLVDYTVDKLVDSLGKPEDDADNTFTARLLLLLESSPLVGDAVYKDIVSDVIAQYWRDLEGRRDDFVPAFLSNDILRLWRTLCVNYEANTLTEPSIENLKRKTKNYKLKHSRLLTCYSALLYLLAFYNRKGTVTPDDVLQIISTTPTHRIEWLAEQDDLTPAHNSLAKIMNITKTF